MIIVSCSVTVIDLDQHGPASDDLSTGEPSALSPHPRRSHHRTTRFHSTSGPDRKDPRTDMKTSSHRILTRPTPEACPARSSARRCCEAQGAGLSGSRRGGAYAARVAPRRGRGRSPAGRSRPRHGRRRRTVASPASSPMCRSGSAASRPHGRTAPQPRLARGANNFRNSTAHGQFRRRAAADGLHRTDPIAGQAQLESRHRESQGGARAGRRIERSCRRSRRPARR